MFQVKNMEEKTVELLKKFEREHEVYISATDMQTYWILFARIPKGGEIGTHNLHISRKYVSGPSEGGNILILPDPENSDSYETDSWGDIRTIDEFVQKALPHILEFMEEMQGTSQEKCGSSCG